MTSARDLIMGTSCPAMSFNYHGDKIVGTILTEPKAVQQTVYDPRNPSSKELAFWPSGDPKMQVIFQVQTQWRNYEGINNPDRTKPDDGRRTIYLKGKHMERATGDAVRAAGAEWMDPGGMVSFEYIGDDMESKAGVKPKLFAVRYRPPAQQAPQHFQQYGNAAQAPAQPSYGANGMAGQGYQAQNAPRLPQAANPAEQYARHRQAQQAASVQATRAAAAVSMPGFEDMDPWATPVPVAPPHHGTENSMPDWATPAAPSSGVPSSAPPALSTLEMIKNAGQSDSGGFGSEVTDF